MLGVLPASAGDASSRMKVVANFAKSIPDMKFDIKEVLVSGNRVIVRGEYLERLPAICSASRTPARASAIMAVDIQTIRDARWSRPITWKTG